MYVVEIIKLIKIKKKLNVPSVYKSTVQPSKD